MAAIKDSLTAILNQLKSLTDTATGSPVFNSVAVFNNQFEQLERGEVEALPLPCCLVEMVTPISWVPIGAKLKQADVTWRIHIGMEQLDAGDGTMEQNLDVFDQLRDPVIAGLTGFKPAGCGQLFTIDDNPDYRHTNLYHFVVSFKCGCIDSKGSPYDPASPKYTQTTPPLELEVDSSISSDPVADGIEDQFKWQYQIRKLQTDPKP